MHYELNKLYRIGPSYASNVIVFSKLSDMNFTRRSSPAIGLKFVLDGREDYTIDDRDTPVTAGEFIIVNAHEPYAAVIPQKQVAIGLCVDIGCDIISDVYNVSCMRKEEILEKSHCASAFPHRFSEKVRPVNGSGFAQRLITLTRYLNNNGSVMPGEEFFYELAFELIRETTNEKIALSGIDTKKQSTKEEIYRRLKIARAVLNDSLFTHISLDELAAACSLSKFHLLRLFKTVYHTSPRQYQVTRKMEFAAMLLKTGKRTVGEISLLLGYADQQSFSKLFKRHFGKSPGEFRNR